MINRPDGTKCLDPVQVAVVGLGYWGPNLVRVLHEIEGASVRAICDVDESALSKVGRRYPTADLETSLDRVLEREDVDAVVIATPVSTHHSIASAALAAGKHVFVEKPLASSAAAADDLAQRARAADLVLMPGHTFLYSPPVMTVYQLIRDGVLGEVYFISTSRVNLGLHQPDVSVIWDLGPHDFSILRYWLGENPVEVAAFARDCVVPGTPDVAFVNLSYASGTVAHAELSWLAPSKLRRTAVVGSEKMVIYDDTSIEPIRIFDSGVSLPDPSTFGEYKLTYRTGDIISPAISSSEPLSLEMIDFCRAVRTGEQPRSDASVGVDVVRVAEAVEGSLAANGAPVPVLADGIASSRG